MQSITNFLPRVIRWFRRRRSASTPEPPTEVGQAPLSVLAALPLSALPPFVRESEEARDCLALLGALDWEHFPERSTHRLWPGPKPLPRAAFVAAFLLKLDNDLTSMRKLRRHLVRQPALVWLLGFPLVPSAAYSWGFDVEASLPTHRHFSRVLRTLDRAQLAFLLRGTVQLLDLELPDYLAFGKEISLDTKHILAWVRENNPKAYIADRYDKTRQPKNDPDCKLGCKKKSNKLVADKPTHDGSAATPTQEALPARNAEVGEYYWGYASGIVATKIDDWGEFVLAEYTQTFDKSDQSYFFPLMEQTETNLGRKPHSGALDAAYDAFYVYGYFHDAGGFAAVPWSKRGEKKFFSAEGLPLCAAGLAMPWRSTFWNKSRALVPHECARYGCPLLYPAATGDACPIGDPHWENGGCLTTLPTNPGNRIRHELDRESPEYKALYKQRTATERLNALALELGIERPKLRNQRSIANNNTLIYVLLNLRALARVRQQKAALAPQALA
ncbi:MAG: hypothetical protein KDE58_21500 [Caldilineaceae bacterium]|nr:hypothetical protein [Caldilineaceae bacterium]